MNIFVSVSCDAVNSLAEQVPKDLKCFIISPERLREYFKGNYAPDSPDFCSNLVYNMTTALAARGILADCCFKSLVLGSRNELPRKELHITKSVVACASPYLGDVQKMIRVLGDQAVIARKNSCVPFIPFTQKYGQQAIIVGKVGEVGECFFLINLRLDKNTVIQEFANEINRLHSGCKEKKPLNKINRLHSDYKVSKPLFYTIFAKTEGIIQNTNLLFRSFFNDEKTLFRMIYKKGVEKVKSNGSCLLSHWADSVALDSGKEKLADAISSVPKRFSSNEDFEPLRLSYDETPIVQIVGF